MNEWISRDFKKKVILLLVAYRDIKKPQGGKMFCYYGIYNLCKEAKDTHAKKPKDAFKIQNHAVQIKHLPAEEWN